MKKNRKHSKLNLKKLKISKLNNPRTIKGGFAAILDDDDSGQNTQNSTMC
ncbi:hypothetical protein [Aquimarina litoralis]|nr:hypothetical protein [Aquimarina litoralis]